MIFGTLFITREVVSTRPLTRNWFTFVGKMWLCCTPNSTLRKTTLDIISQFPAWSCLPVGAWWAQVKWAPIQASTCGSWGLSNCCSSSAKFTKTPSEWLNLSVAIHSWWQSEEHKAIPLWFWTWRPRRKYWAPTSTSLFWTFSLARKGKSQEISSF